MKGAGLALVAATAGCNAIFGVHDVTRGDGAITDTYDAGWWSMHLTWMSLESPGAAITFDPIVGAKIEIGPADLSSPLVEIPIDSTGTFLVPVDVPSHPYRLVYTIDGLPTEIQSKLTTGQFVVPMVGRVARELAPMSSLMSFAPAGAPPVLTHSRLMTVGLWSLTMTPPGDQISLPYTYAYTQLATSQNGPLGSLNSQSGDLEVVMSVDATGSVTGFAVMSVPQIFPNPPGPTATASSTWMTPLPTTLNWNLPSNSPQFDPATRLMAVTGYNSATDRHLGWGGAIPSLKMPEFNEPTSGGLDRVQFAPMSISESPPHLFVNALMDTMTFPTAVYTQYTTSRIVDGVTLTSGFQGIELQTDKAVSVKTDYTVGIAHRAGIDVTLTPAGGAAVTLANADGKMLVLNGASVVDLSFDADRQVDDCIATLYQISTGAIAAVRRLHVLRLPMTDPFHIDAAVFAHGATYTFGVVCRQGLPMAQVGDFTQVSYPFQTSTLYSATFTVM
jgi:hypothetical protein